MSRATVRSSSARAAAVVKREHHGEPPPPPPVPSPVAARCRAGSARCSARVQRRRSLPSASPTARPAATRCVERHLPVHGDRDDRGCQPLLRRQARRRRLVLSGRRAGDLPVRSGRRHLLRSSHPSLCAGPSRSAALASTTSRAARTAAASARSPIATIAPGTCAAGPCDRRLVRRHRTAARARSATTTRSAGRASPTVQPARSAKSAGPSTASGFTAPRRPRRSACPVALPAW